jgi:short subunit dehydrogenase-like uncharacterized protein
MLYGATGDTGVLLAREAVARGMRPILAGRNPEKVSALATALGLEHRVFGLESPGEVRAGLEGIRVVLHAAGPYAATARPMLEACLDAGASYLDLTGELAVIEHVLSCDEAARARGVLLVPAVGFDVVPTDCLARHVAERVEGATLLEIALLAPAGVSAGTAKSMVRILAAGGQARENGELRPAAMLARSIQVRFPVGTRQVSSIPLADLSTAYRTTGIPNIVTYAVLPTKYVGAARIGAQVAHAAVQLGSVRGLLDRLIDRRVRLASSETRAGRRATAWARASRPDGFSVEGWMETMDPYAFTAVSGVLAAQRALSLQTVGASTPALAFGKDFALEVEGTRRRDALG